MVERNVANVDVVGSNPIARFRPAVMPGLFLRFSEELTAYVPGTYNPPSAKDWQAAEGQFL